MKQLLWFLPITILIGIILYFAPKEVLAGLGFALFTVFAVVCLVIGLDQIF